MPRASELKSGMVVEIDGQPYAVKQVDAKTRGKVGINELLRDI